MTSILVKLLTFEIHRLSCFHTMSSVDPLRCSRHRITYRITTFVKTFKYVRHLPHSPLTTKSCELRSSQTQPQCTTHTQQSSLFFCCYRTPLRSHETAQQAPSSPTAPAHHAPQAPTEPTASSTLRQVASRVPRARSTPTLAPSAITSVATVLKTPLPLAAPPSAHHALRAPPPTAEPPRARAAAQACRRRVSTSLEKTPRAASPAAVGHTVAALPTASARAVRLLWAVLVEPPAYRSAPYVHQGGRSPQDSMVARDASWVPSRPVLRGGVSGANLAASPLSEVPDPAHLVLRARVVDVSPTCVAHACLASTPSALGSVSVGRLALRVRQTYLRPGTVTVHSVLLDSSSMSHHSLARRALRVPLVQVAWSDAAECVHRIRNPTLIATCAFVMEVWLSMKMASAKSVQLVLSRITISSASMAAFPVVSVRLTTGRGVCRASDVREALCHRNRAQSVSAAQKA